MRRNTILLLAVGLFSLFVSFRSMQPEPEPQTVIQLGQRLFFDPILSKNRTVSCASCHKPEFAFADTMAFSLGVDAIPTTRNTPSAMNSSSRLHFFWDGRAASLEEQALKPIEAAGEMNLPIAEAVERLNADPVYAKAFRKLFKSKPSAQHLAKALADYERTLESTDTPYDRFINGDDQAMSEEAVRGRILFIGKANCANCHAGDDFTADRFKSIGLFNGKEFNDPGRFAITKDSTHLGLFKIPGLRNVALTAPYMHDGRFKTLRQVIDYYNNPDLVVKNSINRDVTLNQTLGLSERDISDLEAFLHALTDDRFTKQPTKQAD